MKPTHLIPLVLVVAACNLFRKDKNEDVAADGAAVTTATGTVGTTAPSLLDKALSFVSGGPFEGEITMNVTNKDKPVETVVYMVKGPKMRFNMPEKRPGESGYAIFDTTTKKVTTVIDSRKMAMVIDLNGAMGNMATRAANAQGNSHVDRTGKTDTVAGYLRSHQGHLRQRRQDGPLSRQGHLLSEDAQHANGVDGGARRGWIPLRAGHHGRSRARRRPAWT